MHLEEINNIQNVNLGWFAIEQYDELDSDHEFFMLLGRLRRSLEMTDEFKALGMPLRSGFVIGNSGEHSGKKLWHESTLEDSECIEANTFDNADILPKDYLEGLEVIKNRRPEIYKQYVMNSWELSSVEFTLIKAESLNALKGIRKIYPYVKRIIACDPALGGDECVIQVIENYAVIHQEIMFDNDETKIAAKIAELGEDFDVWDFTIDEIGIGHGVSTFLGKLVNKQGKIIFGVNSSVEADQKDLYFNKKTEMWFYLSNLILDKKIPYIEDDETRRQLAGVKYEPVMRRGKVKLEDKQKSKKTLKCSPDRADCFVYGVYNLQFAREVHKNRVSKLDNYKLAEPRERKELGIINY